MSLLTKGTLHLPLMTLHLRGLPKRRSDFTGRKWKERREGMGWEMVEEGEDWVREWMEKEGMGWEKKGEGNEGWGREGREGNGEGRSWRKGW